MENENEHFTKDFSTKEKFSFIIYAVNQGSQTVCYSGPKTWKQFYTPRLEKFSAT